MLDLPLSLYLLYLLYRCSRHRMYLIYHQYHGLILHFWHLQLRSTVQKNRQLPELSAFQWSLTCESKTDAFFFSRSSPPRGRGARTNDCWLFGDRNVQGDTGPLSALYTGFLGLDWGSYVQLTAVGSRSLGHGPADYRQQQKKSLGCQNPAHRSNQLVNSSYPHKGKFSPMKAALPKRWSFICNY